MNLGGYTEHEKVSGIRYEQPSITADEPLVFMPEGLWTPTIDAENILYQSLFKPFSINQYLYPRPPIDMGWMDNIPLNDVAVNVLRMPLKFPGTGYRIPRQLEALGSLIQRVAEYEAYQCKRAGVDMNSTFCHITYDNSLLKADEYHRFPGFHGDGIQGTKLTPKAIIEHSYVYVTEPPTEFCLQPFFLKHLDEAKHNYFLEFDRQAKDVNIYGSLSNHLYLIDPYMVHRSPLINQVQNRLFIRITYAFTELQHPKNTVNPLFDGQQYNKRVDIRENLMPNEFEVPWHLYGLSRNEDESLP